MPTPIFIPETKNHEPITTAHATRRRRKDEPVKELPTKFKSCAMRSLIEEDVDISRVAALERYEMKSEGEGTSSKSLIKFRKLDARNEGVDERLERLKEELLAELKS